MNHRLILILEPQKYYNPPPEVGRGPVAFHADEDTLRDSLNELPPGYDLKEVKHDPECHFQEGGCNGHEPRIVRWQRVREVRPDLYRARLNKIWQRWVSEAMDAYTEAHDFSLMHPAYALTEKSAGRLEDFMGFLAHTYLTQKYREQYNIEARFRIQFDDDAEPEEDD